MTCVSLSEHTTRPAEAAKRIRSALFAIQTTPLDVVVYQIEAFQQRQAQSSLEQKIAREGDSYMNGKEKWSSEWLDLAEMDLDVAVSVGNAPSTPSRLFAITVNRRQINC